MRIVFALLHIIPALLLSACDTKTSTNPTAANCIQSSPCKLTDASKLWLSSALLHPETPFTVNLLLPENWSLTDDYAQLSSRSMAMGHIPVFFEKRKTDEDAIHYQAQLMTGYCSDEVMHWQLVVKVSTPNGIKVLKAPVITQYP